MIQIFDESKLLRTNSQVQTLLYCALESSSSSEVQSLIEMAIEKSKTINSIIENKPESYQQPKTPAVETISTKNTFAERLKLVLRESGITQTELAKCMGVSQSLISSLVTGKRHGIEYSTAISNALGINKWWLAYGEGEMTDFCTSKTEEL
ncbi:helix-turn-helix domain-containing protein [Proteus mirabilis]|uniref:helix-turn-helix domain-containing protein n=1 Tax=Proteus mirabilis TaxID=584 RepID=UPI001FF2A40D|nr:helix-turn-helix transcriptional regulator [Proteus mirabilis]MCJ8515137.1 helix-turn-helix domain-containing protein [Proteus mirabilis]MCT0095332.1 helix-turn-helix domain-containing protein [Proteus mirabilis]